MRAVESEALSVQDTRLFLYAFRKTFDMIRDITPLLLARCEFCEDETANCHSLGALRWSQVDPNSSAEPVPICEPCHESSDDVTLEWKYLARINPPDRTFDKLRECCGYVENGTPQIVSIEQDDATRWWCVSVEFSKERRNYSAFSLKEAIEKAYEAEHQFDDNGDLI
jgi:hypothetical protein